MAYGVHMLSQFPKKAEKFNNLFNNQKRSLSLSLHSHSQVAIFNDTIR